MKKTAARLSRPRLWIALVLGVVATLIGVSIAIGLENVGAPAWLIAPFGAPLFLGARLAGDNVHSSFFLPGMLTGFAVGSLIRSAVLFPLARWFTPED